MLRIALWLDANERWAWMYVTRSRDRDPVNVECLPV